MSKKKYIVEYDLKSVPPSLLWIYIGTRNGLADWFADDVRGEEKQFIFYWNKSSQEALMLSSRVGSHIRFHWLDDEDPHGFFELRITTSELTGSTMLTVTDFADADEMEDSRGLWDYQIESLRRKLGV